MVMEFKRCLLELCVVFAVITTIETLTMKQVKSTGKMMRNTCQPKFKVVDEQIDHIKDGVFNEDHEVMCYVSCILKMANTMKNGKLNFEAAMKQIDMLMPEEIKEPLKESLVACRKVLYYCRRLIPGVSGINDKNSGFSSIFSTAYVSDSYKDVCEASFYTAKCMYTENPTAFVFP